MKKWILLSIVVALSCKKVINVNLNNASPQIVIEGNVTNEAGPYQVKITKTVNFSNTNTFPPVTGATVRITDSTTGQTALLAETDSGVYTTNSLTGTPQHTYNLFVTAEGQQYTASSTMPLPVPLDSVTFIKNSNFGTTIINAVPNFQDPPGLGNYYQFNEFINGKQLKRIFVFEDRLSDGKYISQQLFTDSSYLKVGDSVLLQMNCVDHNIYKYFFALSQVTDANNFQSATPANPNTNISGSALGYFSAHTTTSKKVVVNVK